MPNKDDEGVKDESKSAAAKKPRAKTEQVTDMKAPATAEAANPVSTVLSDEPAPRVTVAPSNGSGDGALAKSLKTRDMRGTIIKIASVVIALAAVIIIIFGILVYSYRSDNPVVKAVGSIVPYPVESVNGHFVTYKSYLFEVDANEKAYQNNAKLNNQPAVDFNSAEGKKLVTQVKQHALDKLASDSLTAQLASQKNVKVSNKEVTDLINQLYTRYGGKDTLLKTLKQIYGWDLNDLNAVVYKQLLAKDLQDKVTSDPAVDAAAKAKAQGLVTQIKNGADFTDLAKKNSQASDAASGGDLGFFTKGQLPAELQTAAEALQPGQVSDPVKDQYGYEILKVIEKKDDGSIHAQHILVKTVDFTQYFQGQLGKAKVNKYLKV